MQAPRSASPAAKAPSFEGLVGRAGLAWMGQNTTHLAPPVEVEAAIRESVDRREYQLYAPAGGFAALRRGIVDDLEVPGLDCWVTDGAVGGLHHVVRTLAHRVSRLVTTDPGWPWPSRFAAASGVPTTTVPVYERPSRLAGVEQLAEAVEQDALLYLIDPLNPLGSSYDPGELAEIVELARAHSAYIVHDATYRHFADAHTLAATLYPERTITTYSFSKWLGLAGFRLGAIVAAAGLLGELTDLPANPLGSSIVGQRAAIAGLEVRGPWLDQLRRVTRSNLDAIETAVAATPAAHVVVPRSQGNFLAIDIGGTGWDPEALCAEFLDRDIFIRPGSYQSVEFGNRFVKVSASVPEQWAERFAAAWPDVIGASPQ